jgi:DNA-binding NtrC family response regulator
VASKARILAVDDEAAILHLLVRTLERQGYFVIGAGGGQAAINLASAAPVPFDLLITDIKMPDLDGVMLARQLLDRAHARQVLFISGFTGHPEGLFPESYFLEKPFTPARLCKTVRRILNEVTPDTGLPPVPHAS